MSHTRKFILVGGLAAVAGAIPARAQQKVTLGKPAAEHPEPLTNVRSVRELPSGKVLVVDPTDKVVEMVDFAAGTSVKVGREGEGPGEYRVPGVLLALPNGETLLHDLAARRFLAIGPDGKPGSIVEMPRLTGGDAAGPVIAFSLNDIRGSDSQGRIYFQGSPFSKTGGTADSVPILRWDRVHPVCDTLGFVKLPAGSATSSRSGNGVQIRIGGGKVFAPIEAWDVAGDGRIALVKPAPYRVMWIGGGMAMAGPVQPFTSPPVTEADKALYKEAMKKIRPTIVSFGGGGGSGPPPKTIQQDEPDFAETMPPFNGRGSVLATPEGEVWVLRTRSASDKIPSYDVFDRTGTLVKKISLNPNSRVIGFGHGTVYVVRTDQDDLQYLQKYQRP